MLISQNPQTQMDNLFAAEAPLTPPSGVIVAFQHADGTWPSSLDTYHIPTPPPSADSLAHRCDLLEDECKYLRGAWLRSKNESILFAETSKKFAATMLTLVDRLEQNVALMEDMSARLKKLENQTVILDQRAEFLEIRQSQYDPSSKRRKLFDFEDPFDIETE